MLLTLNRIWLATLKMVKTYILIYNVMAGIRQNRFGSGETHTHILHSAHTNAYDLIESLAHTHRH